MSSSPRNAVLLLFGHSAYDSINAFNREVMRILPSLGFDPIAIHITSAEQFNADLGNTIRDYTLDRIAAVFSFSGFGFEIGDTAPEGNLWQRLGIPILSWMLDHPAYFLKRHKHPSPAVMQLYPNRDFLEYHAAYVRSPFRAAYCPFGIMSYGRPPELRKPKPGETPLIIFPKSFTDPITIEASWRLLPVVTQRIIRDALDHYWDETPRSGTVTPSVMIAAVASGVELRNDLALQSFFIAQLDDYIRKRKADLLARQLLPFPVKIYGHGLAYLDHSSARAEILPPLPYDELMTEFRASLAVISMNQNIDDEMHDRPYSALGCGALPITDVNPWWKQHYPALLPYSYNFRDQPVAAAIEKTIADPASAAEIAWQMAVQAKAGRSFEQTVADALNFAAMHRYFSLKFVPPQNYYTKPAE